MLFAETLEPGEFISFSVSDTGKGIPPESYDSLFDPFFTTKPSSRGLGLSVVQGFIQSVSGMIQVSSVQGSGSSFEILLPRVDLLGAN
jgi:signal transduction histidine kinase